ncbi:MAG: tetraacyldisaccharide 4'-kinase [Flavobacteriales bacterium]
MSRTSSAAEVGDEPLLMKQRLRDIPMAGVCENRLLGIKELKQRFPNLKWVVLDDALQHRRLKGNVNILLTEFYRPFFKDFLVPAGNLRDHQVRAKDADLIISTKCPAELNVEQMDLWESKISLDNSIPVVFSKLKYDVPKHVYTGLNLDFQPDESMVVTGIAKPKAFIHFVENQYNLKKIKTYPDHHPFTVNDMAVIQRDFDTFTRPSKAIFTTEKDAVKMADLSGFEQLPIYYIPISVEVFSPDGSNWLETLERLMKEKIN